MCSEVENGYTFRMGDHEITMRDSFASMLDTTQLTDTLLVCHSHLKDSTGSAGDSGTNGSTSGLTNGHSSPSPTLRTGSAAAVAAKSDQIIRTHRVILSASSDYFRSVFSVAPNLNTGVIAVIVTNVDFDDLQSIVDFIYKGQVSVGQSRIHKFLSAAQLLMVKGLMNIKLVSNDNQPIDEHNQSGDSELIQRLQNEKRLLEQEVQSMKDSVMSKLENTRREAELELRKKFDLEKSILSEEKQRFEAEKMKFTIEREVFEKTKSKELSNKSNNTIITTNNYNNSSNSLQSNKTIILKSNGLSDERSAQKVDQNQTNGEDSKRGGVQRESPNKVGQQIRIISGIHLAGSTVQKFSSNTDSQIISKNSTNFMTESPNSSETEGRQLRKRIKINDNTSEGQESGRPNNDSKMDVEEEDGEVYEVDFSECVETQSDSIQHQSNRQRVSQTLVNTTITDTNTTNIVNNLSSTPQSAAIVASALAYHKTTLSQPNTPSQLNTVRNLRRSTSSHGSASTKSMTTDNHIDPEVIQRKKGPGRTPNWAKETPDNRLSLDSNGVPETRGRTQRQSSQELSTSASGAGRQATGHLYSCPYCPQVYHGNQSMQDHINGIHLNSKTQYICDYCGKVYTWRISLNKHLKTVHPDEPIIE